MTSLDGKQMAMHAPVTCDISILLTKTLIEI